jgi:hypothetical protein
MSRMAPLTEQIRAERRMRDLLREADLPQPDSVEYGESCIRLRYDTQMVCLVIDLDADADGDRHRHRPRDGDPDAPPPERPPPAAGR